MLGNTIPEIEVHALLKSFRDARLIAEMDGRYLSLAVWRNRAAQEQVASVLVMRGLPEPRLLLNEFESVFRGWVLHVTRLNGRRLPITRRE